MTEQTATEPQTPTETPDPEQGEVSISQWEFIDRVPTRDDVLNLLATLPPVWGINTVDFADYVQALPQRKKVKVPHPTNPALVVDQHLDCYTLYVSVAGRLKMLQAAAELHGWAVDFEPEPVTPTGAPGYISLENRIVYREYCVISEQTAAGMNRDGSRLGRKSGTAWVPSSGGSNAAGSNPYEKVETSARGRAIAAWGFGVLPGSGVASVEEIQGARLNRAHLDAEEAGNGGGRVGADRRSRTDLLQEALTTAEEVRQARGVDEDVMRQKVAHFLVENLGIARAYDADADVIRWDVVKDGQILLLLNSLRDTLRNLRDAESAV